MSDSRPKQVTVVGGGFSGAFFAHHLLRASPVPVVIEVAEERSRLGAGVAYSAREPHQTTNVPAPRMSVYPEDRTQFERWLAARGESAGDKADHYPQRFLFGAYMDELVRSTVPAHPDSALRHRRTRIVGISRTADDLSVQAMDGRGWMTDAVALATGNPTPVPPPLARLSADPRIILDPWSPGALDAVRWEDRILVVGIGLSMGEAVAGLLAAGHRGEVVAIARRGRQPERGLVEAPVPFGDFAAHRPTTAIALARHFRTEVRRAEAAGLSWRSVAAAVRAHGWESWASLAMAEKRRFVRHLRPFWEALRHVMPGRLHDRLLEEARSGRLQVPAASLRGLDAAPDGLTAMPHRRGAGGDVQCERFDIVLNCTGPAYATLTETDPFWGSLARTGLVSPDQFGLGIAVDSAGQAADAQGKAQSDLLVLGTLARGTFGELTGVPELSRQARDTAHALVASWAGERASRPDTPVRRAAAG